MAIKRAAPAATISLPTAPSVPCSELGDFIMLLYGLEKIGKTSLAAMFPDAFFLMFEPGGKSLRIYQRPVNKWDDFLQYILQLEKDKRFKTVVIDTIDLCYKMCEAHVCKQMGIDHPSDEDYGKAWGRVTDEFARLISRLARIGKGVIFISHSKEQTIRRKGGSETHRIVPTMASGARRVIEPMVDIWCYYDYDADGGRELYLRGDDLISAGTRLTEHFLDVQKIPMGGSAAEAFKNFMLAFNNELQSQREEKAKETKRKIVVRK